MMKLHILKNKLAPYLFYLYRPFRPRGASIIAYHRLHSSSNCLCSDPHPPISISTVLFEKQVQWLRKHFHVVRLSELLKRYKENRNIDNLIAITFDDGWQDFYTYGFQILKKYQISASLFPITAFIGTENAIWFSAIGRIVKETINNRTTAESLLNTFATDCIPSKFRIQLKEFLISGNGEAIQSIFKTIDTRLVEGVVSEWSKICLQINGKFVNKDYWVTWKQMHEMDQSGLVEFGVHGHQHYFLTTVDDRTVCKDIIEAKEMLEQIQNVNNCYCYPGGLFQLKHISILKKLNLEFALTYSGGKLNNNSNRHLIPRIGMNSTNHIGKYIFLNSLICTPGYFKIYPVKE
jgi:peptidoglycan/xylan/chitin deacetylase (PgdA/CDA1 family)